MELFYNPERMSEREIKETFVAYQWLVDEIVSILKRQPKGAGVQHVVIVAPRGMGKTTLLLMLRFAVLNTALAKRWQPILFPEESYGVYDLADLWVEFLNHIASETGDADLRDEVSELKVSHPDSDNLEAVSLAKIKDWRKKNKKRLLMLLDNFDMILEQIGDEKDNAKLRDVLMNDDTLMLVGGSTTFFKEARAYDQPLYNLFKIYNLDGLNSEQIEDLLRRRAKLDGVDNFEEILRANRTRLRVLKYFTGGNPRLVLMLYRVITHSQISDVRRGLEKLLDEVTPYYKAKIEALPPQQRKILDQIARITGQTREGLTPTEIAPATRLPVNHVSAQLKRLADLGYVRMANIPGRSSYYTLSEPLYAIWHQMRFSRETRKRMNWLIDFLKGWYDAKELGTECQRLEDIFRNYLSAGREEEARDALEYRRYLMEAIEDRQSRARTLESIILSYLDMSDTETLKQEILSKRDDVNLLSDETRQRLTALGLLGPGRIGIHTEDKRAVDSKLDQVLPVLALLYTAVREGKYREAKNIIKEVQSQIPADSDFFNFFRAISGLIDDSLDEGLFFLESLLKKTSDPAIRWFLKGTILSLNSRLEEAVDAFKRSIQINALVQSYHLMANTLAQLGRYEEALTSYDEALRLQPNLINALFDRCYCLIELKKTEEALQSLDNIIELSPKSSDAHFLKGVLLFPANVDASLSSLIRAFDLKSTSDRTLVNTLNGKSLKIKLSVLADDLDQVRSDWKDLERYATEIKDQSVWIERALDVLTFVAKSGKWELAKGLITSSNLDEQLFPLARALDYLLEDEVTSIEKLSPEVRRIVDEIVSTLENASADNGKTKTRIKSTNSSRKRKPKRHKENARTLRS